MTANKTAKALETNPPLSNLHLTLLNLYASNVSEEDLKAIRRLIARYFAEKTTAKADKDFIEKGYTVEGFLKGHLRIPFRSVSK